MRKDDDMLSNIFLDTEFEKKITEMTIEAIEANDIWGFFSSFANSFVYK